MIKNRIYILDVTNRDGVQTSRLGLAKLEKSLLNVLLNEIGVFQSEIGFPNTRHELNYLNANIELAEMGVLAPMRLSGWTRATAADVTEARQLVPRLKHINISLSSENKINPFDLPRAIGGDAKPEDIIRSAVITLKGLVRLMLGELNHVEDSIVDRALLETFAKKDIVPGADLSAIEPPIMQDFQDILEGMEGTEDLVVRLKKYTEGTFSGLLNSPTTLRMNNQLVVFSVRDLEDELRPIGIYTIVNFIWNTVRSERKKRILVIDEAWWLMQYEDSAKFVHALVKRCRKYYLGITTITQDVNDFLTSPYGQAIVTNSSLQMLLKQSPAAIDLIARVFLLTQSEKYLLLEAGRGEGIFFAGSKHAAIQVVASYSEDQIVTTDPKQLLRIEQEKKELAASRGGA